MKNQNTDGTEIENFVASKDIITHYLRLDDTHGTFCLPCHQKLPPHPSQVKAHVIHADKHTKSLPNFSKGAKKPVKLTVDDLLRENQDVLKVFLCDEVCYVRCLACHENDDKAMKYNFYTIKGHLSNDKHKGIINENDDDEAMGEIPIDADDPFRLHRLKYERTRMLKVLEKKSDTAAWAEVKYFFGDSRMKYFCKYCDIFLHGESNYKLTRHGCGRYHKNNVPDECGRTQNIFECEIVETFMAGKERNVKLVNKFSN